MRMRHTGVYYIPYIIRNPLPVHIRARIKDPISICLDIHQEAHLIAQPTFSDHNPEVKYQDYHRDIEM